MNHFTPKKSFTGKLHIKLKKKTHLDSTHRTEPLGYDSRFCAHLARLRFIRSCRLWNPVTVRRSSVWQAGCSAWRCALRSARTAGTLTDRCTAAAIKEGVPTSPQRGEEGGGRERRGEGGQGMRLCKLTPVGPAGSQEERWGEVD